MKPPGVVPVSARGAALAVAVIALGWASAGPAPLLEALAEARAPTDFSRDYVTAYARLRLGQRLPPAGEDGNALAAAIGAPQVVLLGGPYHLHPPGASLLVLPLVPLGFAGAALAWLALSLVALAFLAFGALELARPKTPPSPRAVGLAFVALALWPPVLHGLAKGQWSILVAALVTLGLRALERRRPGAAGAWLGVAASLKLTPALLLGWLALRRRRAAVILVATGVGVALAALLVNGLPPWRAWLADAPRDVAVWQTWLANTASLNGLIARLFVGGPFARPLVSAPGLARALDTAVSLALVGAVALATWRRGATPDAERALGAAWLALVVLLNPLAWTHTVVLAVPALALLWGQAPPATLVVAFALLSVPRQTLAALAGPTPVGPAAAPILSLHTAALLILFVTALRAAHGAPAPDPARSPAPP